MKSFIFSFLALILISYSSFAACVTSLDKRHGIDVIAKDKQKNCELTFGWTDWPPFLESARHLQNLPQGFQIDFVQWVMAEMGCQIHYRKMPWAESIEAIKSGEIDFIGRASKTLSRESFAYFSAPYREDLLVLTIRKGEAQKYHLTNIDKMLAKGFRLGVLKGGYFGEQIERLRQQKKFQQNFIEFELEGEILHALNSGKIDGFFEAPYTIDNAVLHNPLYANLAEYPLEILVGDLRLMFSKKSVSASWMDKLNKAIQRVKHSQPYLKHWYWSTIK